MEFSFEPKAASAGSNPAQDRLRKAIERNRAKQSKRSASSSSAGAPPNKPRVSSTPRRMASSTPGPVSTNDAQASLMDRLKAKREARLSATQTKVPASSVRKTVGRAENVEFATTVRKSNSAPAPVSYVGTSAGTTKRKVRTRRKAVASAATHIAVKLAWCFNFFLLLRLIFSNGGVVDYYTSTSKLNDANETLSATLVENDKLVDEIELIKNNRRYQKRLVRDHLGYIAKDEFLILFPKGS